MTVYFRQSTKGRRGNSGEGGKGCPILKEIVRNVVTKSSDTDNYSSKLFLQKFPSAL